MGGAEEGGAVGGVAESQPNYANLDMPLCTGPPPRYSVSGAAPLRQPKPPGINYIQLDLNTAPSEPGPNLSPTSPTSVVSNPDSPGYALIDFNKTEALSCSTRGGGEGEGEAGTRKTRHNSTIGN